MEQFFNDPRLRKQPISNNRINQHLKTKLKPQQQQQITTESTESTRLSLKQINVIKSNTNNNKNNRIQQQQSLLSSSSLSSNSQTIVKQSKRIRPVSSHTTPDITNNTNKRPKTNSILPIPTSDTISDDDGQKVQQTSRTKTLKQSPGSPTVSRSVDTSVSEFCSRSSLDDHLPRGSLTHSSELVQSNRRRYRRWFRSLDVDSDGKNQTGWSFRSNEDPIVQLVYPSGAIERFLLVVPRDEEDEYRPIEDLINVVTTTLAYYLTPEQSNKYFSEPNPSKLLNLSNKSNSNDYSFLEKLSNDDHRRSKGRGSDPSDSPSVDKLQTDDNATPDLVDRSGQPNKRVIDMSQKALIKGLKRSFRNRNGPEFLRFLEWYNSVIRSLSSLGLINRNISEMNGLKRNIWETILGQSYDRRVGPKLELLRDYETWSSNVYGELRPKFVTMIIELIKLRPDQLFIDLGSGVGNIVLQTSLEVGCVSVGFEIMEGCSKVGKEQLDEVVGRSLKLWNVSLGQPVLIQADFTTDPRVGPWLKQADVILVNNQVFTPSLNESIKLLFLDLKQSTKIISLKPFKSAKDFRRINNRNEDSIESILKFVGEYEYSEEFVSWTDSVGKFYVFEIDRSLLLDFKEKQEAEKKISEKDQPL
ncbi:histone methylation protein DOT1-domain-containing protein [Phakopsora pachyrhizi]|uniref:Histone-lysine N-methyltransferase, H3 lysine-79 specific n=1 Tax=Phakopsora pachyrhizi TaxID=170000 RepID=A0AAV0AMM1_PHAPC|nr:histone methylation protein DOT1-domain-containing protein [Phakopsora pachyrhizi]